MLAWCVLPNHYHLAVRATGVPLWRTMASVQSRMTRSFNGRHEVLGPLWQGRYKAKVVDNPRCLAQVLLYIHMNPVAAGLVNDPADYRWSGHGEILGRRRRPLVDDDELLLVFGERRAQAKRSYLEAMAGADGEDLAGLEPGGLPWWRLGRPLRRDDEELDVPRDRPFVDELGRSSGRARPALTAAEVVARVSAILDVAVERFGSRAKDQATVRARELVATLGVERYGLRVKDIATATGARYDTVSLWGRRGAERRSSDAGFRQRLDELDAELCAPQPPPGPCSAGSDPAAGATPRPRRQRATPNV